jgi:hypothetical protein
MTKDKVRGHRKDNSEWGKRMERQLAQIERRQEANEGANIPHVIPFIRSNFVLVNLFALLPLESTLYIKLAFPEPNPSKPPYISSIVYYVRESTVRYGWRKNSI